jgi:hypothetical protein
MNLNRDQACRLTSKALEATKWSRWYAAGPGIILALGAVIQRAAESRESFNLEDAVNYLERLRPFCPALFQDRPEPEPSEVDLKKYADPISGQLPANPWSKDNLNLSEQGWLQQNEPRLAAYLKATADGAQSFSGLAKHQKEKEQREKLRSLVYREDDHRVNPFRRQNLTEQNAFRSASGDAMANFWQREAQQPVILPWLGDKPDLTIMGKMANEKPQLHALVKDSVTVARKWAEDVVAEAKAQQVSAETILGRIT